MGLDQLTFRGKPAELARMPNIAKGMSEQDRALIGQHCLDGYREDRQSRAQWEATYARVLKLALQVMEQRTWPWPNCSNVKFPLVTISAISFHSKAYPALVPAQGAVKCVPIGTEVTNEEVTRCTRISGHMSYQLQECTNWEAETDKGLIALPILGCVFKKTYYDPVRRQRRSDLVLPQNLIVHYYTSDLATCPRVSEYFERTRNEIREYELQGLWLEGSKEPAPLPVGPLQAAKEQAQKIVPPAPAPTAALTFGLIEQQALLDLDGDGYDEPYTVTFEEATGKVLRIITRYRPDDISYRGESVLRIEAEQCYTKIPFIPSPDGGFYDLGFGSLIGPLNHSVDSLINQLIDAGTMATLGGGFLGRGVRLKRGTTTFTPQEWKQVDSTGEDISKSIYPLPVREPSKVLLELLMFLVDYAARISSANEVQLGEALGQNAKAEVVQILNENGARTFAAIFKRIHRATKDEFRKFYLLNRRYPLDLDSDYRQSDKWFKVKQEDYAGTDYGLRPVADPNIVTDSQKRQQALLVFQTAQTVPGHNMEQVVRDYYTAFGVPNIDKIFPGAGKPGATPPAPDAKLIGAQVKQQEAELKLMQFQTDVMERRMRLYADLQKMQAEVVNLYAQAAEHAANASSEQEYAAVARINAAIAAKKNQMDGLLGMLDLLAEYVLPQKENSDDGSGKGTIGGTGAGAASAIVPAMVGSSGGAAVPGVPEPEVTGA